MDRLFNANKVVDKIKEDDSHFRVFPADELRSNKYSYWNIESIGGYRPIKLRNYEDLMNARGFSKPQILNMLNVKYVITKKKINNPNFVKVNDLDGLYKNINVLPKAWLVGKLKNVKSVDELVYKEAYDRAKTMDTLHKTLKEEATDCLIFQKFHSQTGENIQCSNY